MQRRRVRHLGLVGPVDRGGRQAEATGYRAERVAGHDCVCPKKCPGVDPGARVLERVRNRPVAEVDVVVVGGKRTIALAELRARGGGYGAGNRRGLGRGLRAGRGLSGGHLGQRTDHCRRHKQGTQADGHEALHSVAASETEGGRAETRNGVDSDTDGRPVARRSPDAREAVKETTHRGRCLLQYGLQRDPAQGFVAEES